MASEAERAYWNAQGRRRDWSGLMFEAYGHPLTQHVQAVRDAECAMEAALDACIWAVLRERGHVMRCCCASVASLDDYNMSDPRCAPPAWLLEVKK